MFETNSRYAGLPHGVFVRPDGEAVSYVRRRFLPDPDALETVAEVRVTQGDRLDLIASRALGDAEAFWKICDAHRVLRPADLVEPEGRTLRIPAPQFG